MSDNKIADLRKYIAPFITGTNADAIISALAIESQKQQDLSISVTDQLTISTASGIYLDKKLSEKGVIRPPELGMSDISFRKIGIQITAQKQVTEIIQSVLEIFYGTPAVRAYITSLSFGPYELEDGDDFTFALEDGIERSITFTSSDFLNINSATASEVADAITRYIVSLNLNGFADVEYDYISKREYIRIYGGAKGPYSSLTVLGGKAQGVFKFPIIRKSEIDLPNTNWQITRPSGDTLRLRWNGNSRPALEAVKPGDKVLIYGLSFKDIKIYGTFTVRSLRPASPIINIDSGFFDIETEETLGLQITGSGLYPLPNSPTATYSFSANQINNNDLVFMIPKRALVSNKFRYAAAYEPGDYLKIYLPATTGVISRELPGGAYIHVGQSSNTFNVLAGNSIAGIDYSSGKEISKIKTVGDNLKNLQNTFIFIPCKIGYYGFWFNVDNNTSQSPYEMLLLSNYINVVEISQNDSAMVVADKLNTVINSTGFFNSYTSLDEIFVTDQFSGPRLPDVNAGSSPFIVSVIAQGKYNYADISDSFWNEKIRVINDHTFAFKQHGYDIEGFGGTVSFNNPVRSINLSKINREQFITTVTCSQPHNLISYLSPYGLNVTDEIAIIDVEAIETDMVDAASDWPGPFLPDKSKNYTLTSSYANISQPILAGQVITNIQVNGSLPNGPGLFLLNLGQDNEEGPFKYITSQSLQSSPPVSIVSASQNGYNIIISTSEAHGLIFGSQIQILGTGTSMDGVRKVTSVINANTFTVLSSTSAILFSSTGSVNLIIAGARSILILDPSNKYNKNHEENSDITVLSSALSYTPASDGTSYPMYLTGTAQGRIYAESIIKDITAMGINLEIQIIYPSDKGLGNENKGFDNLNPPNSEAIYVWGPDNFYDGDL